MPQCRHCERVLASAELRRTSRGWACKGGSSKWSTCFKLAKQLRAAARNARRAAA